MLMYIGITVQSAKAYHGEADSPNLPFHRKTVIDIDTLHCSTVSNVLRVLCDMRPIPERSIKNNDVVKHQAFIADNVIDMAAINTMVLIKRGIQWHNKQNKYTLILESRIKRYCYDNGKPKGTDKIVDLNAPNNHAYSHLTWERLYDNMGKNGLFGNLCEFLAEITGIPRNELQRFTVIDILYKVFKCQKELKDNLLTKHFGEEYLKKLPEGLKRLFYDGNAAGFILIWGNGRRDCVQDLSVKGAEPVSCRDFELYVPYSDELWDRLKQGGGFATCLDGGVARLGIKKGTQADYRLKLNEDELPDGLKSVI